MAAMSFTSARAQEAKQPEQAATPAIKKTAINLWPGVALGTRLRVSSHDVFTKVRRSFRIVAG
ncbi:MAG TPA: hypothetical protein VGL97_11315, partial [Bryobacteraceae bacterium]